MSVMTASTQLPTGTWSVDPERSRIGFRVKQMGLGAVRGAFRAFEGTLEVGHDGARAHGSVSVASLDTQNVRRDAHLRSPAFLDAERHLRMTFASRSIRPLGGGRFEIAGDLTLHGVTRPLTLTAELQKGEEPDGGRASRSPSPARWTAATSVSPPAGCSTRWCRTAWSCSSTSRSSSRRRRRRGARDVRREPPAQLRDARPRRIPSTLQPARWSASSTPW